METRKRSLNIDLLNGPIFKSLVLFAIPLLISNIFQQLYNTVDTMIVGNFLGDQSLAAIGACSPVYELMVGFALGIGNGLSMVTARFFGRGDLDRLKKSVASSMVIGLIVTISVTIIAQISLYPLLELLKTPKDIIEESYGYISTITLFIIVMFAYNLCSGILRAIGNSIMPLAFLIVSSCTNIVLDILFIAKFGMGLQGAAIATVISQGLSVVLCIIYILKFTKMIIPSQKHFVFDRGIYGELLAQGFSMGFMNCLVSAGSVILQSGINGLGALTIAGHVAARKLYSFTVMPVMAIGMAGNTFISQNRGADNRDRIRRCLKCEYLYNITATIVISLLLQIFADDLVRLISGSNKPTIINNGSLYLRCVSPFYAVLGILGSTRYALQAIGQKIMPIVSSIIEFWGKIIFVILLIPKFHYMAVIFCEPVIWCIMTIQLVISFFTDSYMRGDRKKTIQNNK